MIKKLLNNKEIHVVDEEFGLQIIKNTNNIVKLFKKDDDKYYIKLNSHKCNNNERDRLIFWLRWNSWRKFEKVIRDLTDLENYPSELDYVYGSYWRRINNKEPRFEELYENICIHNNL